MRCGRCNHVFDGRDHLIELGAVPTPATQPQQPPLVQEREAEAGSTPPRVAPTEPAAPQTEGAVEPPSTEDDHGFGMTLIWEEEVPGDDVAEVHLGEVEGATPAPDLQPTAPDTRPLPDEAPTDAAPAESSPAAVPADPFHGLPPIRDPHDEEDPFAAAVPKQPSADLPVEPAADVAETPAAPAQAERHDSRWLRHEADPHTQFAPVPRRQGHTRRTPVEHASPTPQRTLTGAPRSRKVRGPNHGVSAATLDFLRAAQAREQARKSTGRRALARVAIGCLAVLAVAQLLFLARAEIARRVPSTRPLWEAMCQPLHCTVAPPRDLDALQIESSQLQRQEGDASDQYVLTATLRNRAGGPIALPAIELVTTDLQDQLLARRALLPADYLNPTDSAYGKSGLPARAELPIRVRFQSQRPTANYRVLIFYP